MTAVPQPTSDARIFHGWWIVASVFVTQAISSGLTVYSFGLFQLPIAEEFGVSRSVVSLGMTGSMLLIAMLAPVVGRALDTRPNRRLMLAAGTLMAACFVAMTLAPSIVSLGLCFVVANAAGQVGLGPLAASKLVATWFARARGRALGVSAVGTSAGGLVVPPLMAAAILAWGWRGAVIAGAVAIVVLALPTVALAIRNRPSDLGLHPDGASRPPPLPPGGQAASWPPKRLFRDLNFWVITLVIGTIFGVVTGLITNLPPLVAEFGVEPQRAATLLSLLSVSGIAGKLFFGAVADRVDKRLLVWSGMAMLAGFLLVVLFEPSFVALACAGAALGFALGGALPLWGALIGDCYGPEAFGEVMGWMSPVMLPLNITGIQLLPWCYDTFGSYMPAVQGCLGALAVAAGLLLLLRLPRRASD